MNLKQNKVKEACDLSNQCYIPKKFTYILQEALLGGLQKRAESTRQHRLILGVSFVLNLTKKANECG